MAHDQDPRRDPAGSGRPPATSIRPSTVTLPDFAPPGVVSIFDFFLLRFPRIPAATWRDRFAAGKVWTGDEVLSAASPYSPALEVRYLREVEHEPPVRRDVRTVWSDQHLLVVDKPPNLPVIPGGLWVRHCLLHLLVEATQNENITPLHRIDRLSSGLVALSLNPDSRAHFARLFQAGARVNKLYTAVCELRRESPQEKLILGHHIARSVAEYWRQVVVPGRPVNARSELEVMTVESGLALVRIRLLSGRKHQIRVQLAHEGMPILGDPLYGSERSYEPADLSQRLWLDAHRLRVSDLPMPFGNAALTASWSSSRDPSTFLERAAHWQTDRHPGKD